MTTPAGDAGALPRVLRNASLLVIAQVLATPMSILVNAVAARSLGAAAFGAYYQAATYASFAVLFVEWGLGAVLASQVAIKHSRAGELLGSALLLQGLAAVGVALAVPGICATAGYDSAFVVVAALATLAALFSTLARTGQDVIRGYERTDFAAGTYAGFQLLTAAAVVPTLLAGAGLPGMLIAQGVCAASSALFVLAMLPRFKVPALKASWSTVKTLLHDGQPFLAFGLVLLLQPAIDAAMLGAFSAQEGIGWYSAARKLIGVLSFPANALAEALYPTLCRLRAQDFNAYRQTAAGSLWTVATLVVPVALGCFLFPGLGIAIFGQDRYGPAEDDLRILALYLFLLYFSMTLGTCLVAIGRKQQQAWTVIQLACVVISLAADPFLIRWTQETWGNGGLGVCITCLASEVLVVVGGLWLLPKGILGTLPLRKIGGAIASGLLMLAAAQSQRVVPEVLAAALAVAVYFTGLKLLSGVSVFDLRAYWPGCAVADQPTPDGTR
jgi:O-antigen/teichoic acid export membrane protein